jgi:excisionase family DNA binding protein
MIMTLQAGDKLMSLTDVSEMLGIPVHTLYRWRHKGDGPVGYRVGRHVRHRREAVEAWLEQQVDQRWQAQRKNQFSSAPRALNRESRASQARKDLEHLGPLWSPLLAAMDNPTCSPFSSYANPNLVAITTLPRNSQRLTDQFLITKGREPQRCRRNLTPAPRRFGQG